MSVDCNCGDKQWLEFIEGRLTCTNCGSEETEDLSKYVKLGREEK